MALAECCISRYTARETHEFRGAAIDLSALGEGDLIPLLFGESQARIILSTAPLDAIKVIERAKILKIPAVHIGRVGGDQLALRSESQEIVWPLAELHDLWWNAIARAMK